MALGNVPVEDDECLARMVLIKKHVVEDAQTGQLVPTPEAFLPYKHVELSVIRHRELTEDELWKIGREVVAEREAGDTFGRKFTLLGRGDIYALDAREQSLDAVPAEGPGLPRNHADIVGWPPEKAAQLLRAVKLAEKAKFVATPPAV